MHINEKSRPANYSFLFSFISFFLNFITHLEKIRLIFHTMYFTRYSLKSGQLTTREIFRSCSDNFYCTKLKHILSILIFWCIFTFIMWKLKISQFILTLNYDRFICLTQSGASNCMYITLNWNRNFWRKMFQSRKNKFSTPNPPPKFSKIKFNKILSFFWESEIKLHGI